MRVENIRKLTGDDLVLTWRTFGLKVRELRKARGWTQANLADRLRDECSVELHQTMIAKIEGGTRPTAIHELYGLAVVLRVTYDEILPLLPHEEDDVVAQLVTRLRVAEEEAERVELRYQATRHERGRAMRAVQDLHAQLAQARGDDSIETYATISRDEARNGKRQEET